MAAKPKAKKPSQVRWNDPMLIDLAVEAGKIVAPEVLTWPDNIVALLNYYDQDEPTNAAIYQWRSRAYIPDKWRAKIIFALRQNGCAALDFGNFGDIFVTK